MRLFTDVADHFAFLNQQAKNDPQVVKIATYGIYAGIMPDGRDSRDWGDKFRSETREFLESLRKCPSVKIIVGAYDYKSCKGKNVSCYDCERQYVLGLIRLLNHAELFPEFKWRFSTQTHVKCALFTFDDEDVVGVAGGRNMTDSAWADVTVELDKMSTLRLEEYYDSVWKTSSLVKTDRLNDHMLAQGISERTIQQILATA